MSGRVVDIYGNPIQGARVHNGAALPPAIAPPDEGEDPPPQPILPSTHRYSYTDSQGNFTIGNIPPGTYTNRAFLFGYKIAPKFSNPVELTDADVYHDESWEGRLIEVTEVQAQRNQALPGCIGGRPHFASATWTSWQTILVSLREGVRRSLRALVLRRDSCSRKNLVTCRMSSSENETKAAVKLGVECPRILCTTGKGRLFCISSTARDFRMASGPPNSFGKPQAAARS